MNVIRLDPCYELAAMNPGDCFRSDTGNTYILLRHTPLYTELARYYWFDVLFANAVVKLRELIRKIRLTKKGQPIADGNTQVQSNDTEPQGPSGKHEGESN